MLIQERHIDKIIIETYLEQMEELHLERILCMLTKVLHMELHKKLRITLLMEDQLLVQGHNTTKQDMVLTTQELNTKTMSSSKNLETVLLKEEPEV